MVVGHGRVLAFSPLFSAAALVVLLASLDLSSNHDTASVATTTASLAKIPRFSGMTLAATRTLAKADHGSVIVELFVPSNAASGRVLGQGPNPQWPVPLVVSSGPWPNEWAVLPGTHNSPEKKECTLPIVLTEDGNVHPLLCHGGGVNVGAWLFYEHLRPSIMAMGRYATPRQVFTLMCNLHRDKPSGFKRNLTLPEYENAYSLTSAYNGWKFTSTAKWAELVIANVGSSQCIAALLKPR